MSPFDESPGPRLSRRPAVVGIVPGQPELVALTAAEWALATGATGLYFGYADPGRYVVEEFADGTVRHADIDPDSGDDGWIERERQLGRSLHAVLDPTGVLWHLRYLAGRADQALARLADVVDAAVLIVGTRKPGFRDSVREFLEGSVAVQLAHHQHRPVVVVPLRVVDWARPVA